MNSGEGKGSERIRLIDTVRSSHIYIDLGGDNTVFDFEDSIGQKSR